MIFDVLNVLNLLDVTLDSLTEVALCEIEIAKLLELVAVLCGKLSDMKVLVLVDEFAEAMVDADIETPVLLSLGDVDELGWDGLVVVLSVGMESMLDGLDDTSVRLLGKTEVALAGDSDIVVAEADDLAEDGGIALGCTLSALMISAA